MKKGAFIASGFLCVLGLLSWYASAHVAGASRDERVRMEKTLDLIQKNATALQILQMHKSKIPRELKRFDRANIIAFIEKRIRDAKINKSSISRMTPSEVVTNKKAGEIELKITISFKNVQIDRVFAFLYSIENAGIGLTTSMVRLDSSAKGDVQWNVQTVISCLLKRS